jgi:hypothetical protein
MNKKLAVSAALVLIAGIVALTFLIRPRPAEQQVSAATTPPAPSATPLPEAPPRPRPKEEPSPTPPQTPAAAPEMEAWEYRIDEILTGTATEAQSAQLLLNLLPTLPEEGQIEAASHAMNLLPDEHFQQAMPILANPNVAEPVLSVMMTDLMNRPDPIKLRGWLQVARMPGHPLKDEAVSALQVYLDDDYGEDWGKWSAQVEAYIAKEAMEP